MKIVADVKINDRLLPSCNLCSLCTKKCTVTLQKKGIDEIFLTVHSNDDSTDVKYKVKGNLEGVFDEYSKDGKASIIFNEPPHELLINCEGSSLIKFIKTLKLVLGEKTRALLESKNPQPLEKIPRKTPTCVTIMKQEDYKLLHIFSQSIFHIKISGITQHILDQKLLSMSALQILDLSNNDLSSIPKQFDLLPKLKMLNLSSNNLNLCSDWSWMCGENMGKTLEVLDLRHNELKQLPPCIRRLRALSTLRLEFNRLSELPAGIGMLRKLKILSLGYNFLEFLPGTFALLKLRQLDVSANLFGFALSTPPSTCFISSCPSLKELAARAVVDHRMPIGECDLPRTLHDFLDKVNFCVCRRSVFDCCFVVPKTFDLNSITSELLVTDTPCDRVVLKISLCSWKCLDSYNLGGR